MSVSNRQSRPVPNTSQAGTLPVTVGAAAQAVPTRRHRLLGALGTYPTFRQLWLGTMAGAAGQWMQQIAIGWLALVLTNSPAFVGIVAFVAGIPFILVGPPAGNLIDRVDRRRLLLICQSLAALLAVIVAIDIYADTVQPWHLVVAAFLNGCFLSLMTPTQQSLVPTLVDRNDLTNAIALMSAGQNLTRIAGPSVAGIMIAWWGVGPAFVAQAVMLAVAFALISQITLPVRSVSAAVGFGILDGMRVIWRTPELRSLFLMVAIFMLFVAPYLSFINVLARDILLIGASGLGILMAASASGAVLGSLTVAVRGRPAGVGLGLVGLAVIYGLLIAGVAISPFVWLTVLLMFGSGIVGSIVFSLNTAIVQHQISEEVRGRVMSAYFLTWGLMPIGALPMGLLADQLGTRFAIGAGAVISSLLIALLGITSPRLRNL